MPILKTLNETVANALRKFGEDPFTDFGFAEGVSAHGDDGIPHPPTHLAPPANDQHHTGASET